LEEVGMSVSEAEVVGPRQEVVDLEAVAAVLTEEVVA
jgi:hypothetical protein